MSKDNGGPAFPFAATDNSNVEMEAPGMTLRDSDDEAMSWIADCYSHHYQTLCEMICRAAMSGSAESCRAKLLAAASIVEAQLSVYVAQKHFGGVRT